MKKINPCHMYDPVDGYSMFKNSDKKKFVEDVKTQMALRRKSRHH